MFINLAMKKNDSKNQINKILINVIYVNHIITKI